ncbi:LysR family transcriptional regulator, partial [Ruminococcus sp.]
MEYKKISYFIAVAETLSFTRAAERMYVSQQTIT